MNSLSLYVSSRDRTSGTSSNFVLPHVQLNSSSNYNVDVEQCVLPKARANVYEKNNRPFLGFGTYPTAATATQISVANAIPPNVVYDGASLATALTTALTAHCGFAVTVTYSSTTFKLSIVVSAGNCLRFQTTYKGDVTDRFLEITGWKAYDGVLLGGAGAVTYPTIASGVTTFDCSPVKLTDTDWVDICCNLNTASKTTHARKMHVLQRIPTIGAIGTMNVFYQSVVGTTSQFTGTGIQNMVISLFDEWGDEYKLPDGFSLNIVLSLSSL